MKRKIDPEKYRLISHFARRKYILEDFGTNFPIGTNSIIMLYGFTEYHLLASL